MRSSLGFLLAMLGLAACQGTGSQVADHQQLAVVMGRKDLSLLGAVGAIAAAVDGSPMSASVEPLPGMPDEIRIQRVDGSALDKHHAKLAPGPHVLEIAASRQVPETGATQKTLVNLSFDAEPGARYRLIARPSEHQSPWCFDLLQDQQTEPVATSEPNVAGLNLPLLPAALAAWEWSEWGQWADHEFALHRPKNQQPGEAKEQLLRTRSILDPRLTLEAFQYRRNRQLRLAGWNVTIEHLADSAWIERWEPSADGSKSPERGFGIHRHEGPWIVSEEYRTDMDAGAEARCDTWEALLLTSTRTAAK